MIPPISTYVDDQGREFDYAFAVNPGATALGIHFSAFYYGQAGNVYRDVHRGYFHRLKMLSVDHTKHWLFLTEHHGADENGTYYTGEKGDFFVERAVTRIISDAIERTGCAPDRCVTFGSSMGATGAVKFALQFGLKGIVAIAPHIDLDICAARQNRMREVAFICPDGDALSEANFRYTRQIRNLVRERVDARAALPELFIQSCSDDEGVHEEQVVPLVTSWRTGGGGVYWDLRSTGGHTSDYSSGSLLLDAADHLLAGEEIDVTRYQNSGEFAGTPTRVLLRSRLRSQLGLMRRRIGQRSDTFDGTRG